MKVVVKYKNGTKDEFYIKYLEDIELYKNDEIFIHYTKRNNEELSDILCLSLGEIKELRINEFNS